MSVSSITSISNDLLPIERHDEIQSLDFSDKFISWAGEKPKYFVELMVNSLQYLELWNKFSPSSLYADLPINSFLLNKSMRPFFGAVDAMKGITEVARKTFNKSYQSASEVASSVSYTISDTVDLLSVLNYLSIAKINSTVLSFVKNVSALVGLGIDINKARYTLDKLSKVDTNNLPTVDEKNKPEAKIIKAEWVKAETNRVWWERVKNISGACLCTLGLFDMMVFGVPLVAWTVLGTTSLTGKMKLHFDKLEADFWEKRMVQVLDSQKI